jgi:hypothetical protein
VNLRFLSVAPRVRHSNVKFKDGAGKTYISSAPLIPKFASEVPRVFANFGIGALV